MDLYAIPIIVSTIYPNIFIRKLTPSLLFVIFFIKCWMSIANRSLTSFPWYGSPEISSKMIRKQNCYNNLYLIQCTHQFFKPIKSCYTSTDTNTNKIYSVEPWIKGELLISGAIFPGEFKLKRIQIKIIIFLFKMFVNETVYF